MSRCEAIRILKLVNVEDAIAAANPGERSVSKSRTFLVSSNAPAEPDHRTTIGPALFEVA